MATDEQQHEDGEQNNSLPLPPYVQTDDQKRRWGLCEALMVRDFGYLDEPLRTETIWMGTRAIYNDPTIETGDGHV